MVVFALRGGGTAMKQPDAGLFALVRDKLCAGRLWPLTDGSVIGGKGSGETCWVCDAPIGSDDADYEVSRGEIQPAVHVHVACYQAWRGESQRSA
jgi:hypothetical protein